MTGMSWLSAGKLAMCFVFVVLTAGLVHSFEQEQEYLAPSFPSLSMDDPTSVEEVMPYARQAARNRAAAFGGGLGLSTAGETIALVIGGCNNPHIVEAMRRALVEREIAPVVLLRGPNSAIIWDYETHRGSYSDEGCTRESSIPGMTVTEAGFTEGRDPGTVPYPVRLRNWFRSERPDLFQRVYPNRSLEPEPVDEEPNLGFSGEGNDVIIAYLEDHPEVDGVYSGGTWYQEAGNFGPFADKWRGTTFWDRFTIISNVPSYPADVWALTEEKNIEAIAFASRFHLTDPEGTDLEDEISPDLARRWASGIYERGHNMLGPNMATGRFARSTVSYPAMSGEWIPRSPISTPTGVIAGTTNHVGYHPLMKMYYEEGYLTRVEDGGLYGDLARMWLSEPGYPNIHTAQYPYYDGKPGFYYLHEIALGTNPKWFRPPDADMSITTVNERLKSGYLHIGVGASLEHEPRAARRSEAWQRFSEERNVPFYHSLHLHLYFPTYTIDIRNSNRSVDIIRNGRMTSLDDPEVRALASRYGDPDEILAEDWVAEVPGINAPGSFEEYAQDPYPYHKMVNDQILDGTYEHFYPPLN